VNLLKDYIDYSERYERQILDEQNLSITAKKELLLVIYEHRMKVIYDILTQKQAQ